MREAAGSGRRDRPGCSRLPAAVTAAALPLLNHAPLRSAPVRAQGHPGSLACSLDGPVLASSDALRHVSPPCLAGGDAVVDPRANNLTTRVPRARRATRTPTGSSPSVPASKVRGRTAAAPDAELARQRSARATGPRAPEPMGLRLPREPHDARQSGVRTPVEYPSFYRGGCGHAQT
jgi:hypothetical protein